MRGFVLVLLGALLLAVVNPIGHGPAPAPAAAAGPAHTITWDHWSLKIDGRRVFVYSGEVHPFRLPSPDLWPDVLQKMKATGFTAVTAYFDWDYHSPAPGVYDFTGVRDIGRFLDDAARAGLYVITRPGPYINAEANGGGFPGWLAAQPGVERTNDPSYLAAAREWLRQVDPIIARHQLTNGTGSVIIDQVENEFYDTSPAGQAYMQALEDQIHADGITVPLSGNHNQDFASGQGAVDLPGFDSYPQGFNCANPSAWHSVPTWLQAAHAALPPDKPLYFPEFQGGSFGGFGGPGYDQCRQLTNDQFESVFYKSLIGQGATLLSFYMTYGGTSWGWLSYPFGPSSYDYGAALTEGRQLTDKATEQKRIALMLQSVAPLRMTDPVSGAAAPSNPAILQYAIANPATGTHFYMLRHQDGTATTADDTHIAIQTADGSYPSVPQEPGTAITLNGRDARMLVADYDLQAAHLVYSTSELMTEASIGSDDTVLLYGPQGQPGETVLRYAAQPQVSVLDGSATATWDPTRGDLRLDYTHDGLSRVRVTSGGRSLLLLLADTPTSGGFWRQDTAAGTILERGPYLVRSARVTGATLELQGDTDAPTDLEVMAPAQVRRVTWNGRRVATTRTRFGTLTGHLDGPPPVSLPTLDDWRFRFESPERTPGFDDSAWTNADHTTTNNINPPGSLPVLYEDDYGFHQGNIWYRGHFTATGGETGITIEGDGGANGVYSVWLNGALLGTSPSGSSSFSFPPGVLSNTTTSAAATALASSTADTGSRTFTFSPSLLALGRDNVISVMVTDEGHDECGGPCRSFKNPRGIRTAILQGSSAPVAWKIQGDAGGEQPLDPARGSLNTGGLYGERHGWYLPGYPDQGWAPVGLSDSWSSRGLPAGVGWYRTTFDLHLPANVDAPVGLRITDDPSRHYRAYIYLNGWMLGVYSNDTGSQRVYSLPTGILHAHGSNTLAIAVDGEDGTTAGLGQVSLVSFGAYAGGVPVRDVRAPSWNPATWGPPVPADDVTVGLASDTGILSGTAQTIHVTGTVSDPAGRPATNVSVALHAPAGWTVTPTSPTSFRQIRPGRSAKATWTVQVPAGVAPGSTQLSAVASFRQGGRGLTTAGTATLRVPFPSLASTFTNVGISDDSNPSAGDFDGAGFSFSEQALTAAGLAPGATVTHAGVPFTWPAVAPGSSDNTPANGQLVRVTGQGHLLGFLGAGNSGSPSGPVTVFYADGSTSSGQLTLDDFWFTPGPENDIVAGMPYVNSPTGASSHTVYIFYAAVPIDPGKQVTAVTLPAISPGSQGHSTAMHVFAMGVGG